MALGGAALKLFQTILYALEFCCGAIILGIYSYFLSVLADRGLTISTVNKAITGLSGVAVLYTIFAVLLTCFLGGKSFFAFLGIVFDILFAGAFIALAVLTRDGASSCSGYVQTPIGNGQSNSRQGFGSSGQGDQVTYSASLGTICKLNTACFAVAIAGALLFLLSALVQVFIARNHKKEKRFGPGPSNGYTRGSGKKFFGRKNRKSHVQSDLRDPEMAAGAVPVAGTTSTAAYPHHDNRQSYDTAYTGSTVGGGAPYEHSHKPISGGYHTAPTGTYNHPTTATNY